MNWDDILAEEEYLEHEGVKGMRWGERRYQYKDGRLTPLGRIHYGYGAARNKVTDYKKAKSAKYKEKALRSGDMKTVLKYQKYLTDAEFEKAVSRAKKVESLKPKKEKNENIEKLKSSVVDSLTKERHLPERKEKKEPDKYDIAKKEARTEAVVEERKKITEAKNKIADSIVDSLTRKRELPKKSKDQMDYDIQKRQIEAQKVIDSNKNQKVSKINLENIGKIAKKITAGYATYKGVASVVNTVTGKKTMPLTAKDVLDKFGVVTKDGDSKSKNDGVSTFTFDPKTDVKAISDQWDKVNEKKKKKEKPKNSVNVEIATGEWFSTPLSQIGSVNEGSFLNTVGSDTMSLSYDDIMKKKPESWF